jgi:hypothetical protein
VKQTVFLLTRRNAFRRLEGNNLNPNQNLEIMKTNLKKTYLAAFAMLTILPAMALAAESDSVAQPHASHAILHVKTDATTTQPAPGVLRFNLVDGQPIR